MGLTIDHLRVDHRVTVRVGFHDLTGHTMHAGDTGVIRGLHLDPRQMNVHVGIQGPSGAVNLVFALNAQTGPRNGHMREYFDVGEDLGEPRIIPAFQDLSPRKMIVPSQEEHSASRADSVWVHATEHTDGPDRLVEVEESMRRAMPHIGSSASIAEMYAQRMRAFQRAGDEPRAVAAFKLAVGWMGTCASWATSGGEGAALSDERDQFQAKLARELGYDPTEATHGSAP
jgi:hypothetical protein